MQNPNQSFIYGLSDAIILVLQEKKCSFIRLPWQTGGDVHAEPQERTIISFFSVPFMLYVHLSGSLVGTVLIDLVPNPLLKNPSLYLLDWTFGLHHCLASQRYLFHCGRPDQLLLVTKLLSWLIRRSWFDSPR